ncbi:MAG: BolA family transcriptional regulator [Alphaproteobacteria bacterium]|nr:BolA family transcriptional regulator [Alphaproteobacteria bacterium]
MNRAERIREIIEDALAPEALEITDDSHQHAGHAGAQPGGETHYTLTVVSPQFEGQSRVMRQRSIYALLTKEFELGLHALSIRALTPGE